VGLILDLAVVVLAVVVIGSLALLAWTLAVSAVRASRRSLAGVTDARRSIASVDARLRAFAARAGATLEELSHRTGTEAEREQRDA
jgi:type II secretory pathway component PulJ